MGVGMRSKLILISKMRQLDFPSMVRQAHHERKIKWLRCLSPFALSLSKGEWTWAKASC